MAAADLLGLLVAELRRLVDPVAVALEPHPTVPGSLAGFRRALEEAGLGHLLDGAVEAELRAIATDLEVAVADLETLATTDPAQLDLAALAEAIDLTETLVGLGERLGDLATTLEADLHDEFGEVPDGFTFDPVEVADQVWQWLLWRRLAGRSLLLDGLGRATGVLLPPEGGRGPVVDGEALVDLLSDPKARLAEALGWGTDELDTALLYEVLGQLAEGLGLAASVVADDDGTALHLQPDTPQLPGVIGGLVVAVETRDGADVIVLGPAAGGAVAFRTPSPGGELRTALTGELSDLPTIVLGPDGVALDTGSPAVTGAFELEAAWFDTSGGLDADGAPVPGDPLDLVPLGDLGGVTAQRITAGVVCRLGDDVEVALRAALVGGAIEVTPTATDGFLARLLPQEGLRAEFDVAVLWSTSGGIRFEGAAGLEVDVPVGLDLFGVLRIDTAHLEVALDQDGAAVAASVTGGVALGPFAATLSHVGARAVLGGGGRSGADAGGQGGVAAGLSRVGGELGFSPPTGVGLSLDLGPVGGGGFLERDGSRYLGAFQLEAGELGIGAFGVVETELPDGGDGFSMLLFVSGEFAAVQLGFGFTLNGVGGILGVHRDVDVDELFTAVRAGTAGSLLAPDDPVGQAQQLLATAERVFPVTRGQYVVGPTVKLGWGTPTLLELDLALAATLPEPFRLVLIGRLSGAIPLPEAPIVKINLDLAGVLDVTGGRFDLEGQLYDSTIQLIPIEGGFALRSSWKGHRSLTFSIGGLHPQFEPPPRFPDLPRMGTSLSKGSWLRLSLIGYFAITPNTLQLGAAIDLRVSKQGFTLVGGLGLDALVEFDPFRLQVGVLARVQVLKNGRSLLKVSFRGRLSGPNAWHVRGEAVVEVPVFPNVTVSAEATFGRSRQLPSDRVDVWRLLATAVASPAAWTTSRPGPGLVLREDADGTGSRCDPGGPVAFLQGVTAFGVTLDHYYDKPVAGTRRFEVATLTTSDGDHVEVASGLRETFPPAAFRSLSERQRLRAPAFEDLRAGAVFDPSALHDEGDRVDRAGDRVTVVLTGDGGQFTTAPLPTIPAHHEEEPTPLITVHDEQWCRADPGGGAAGEGGTWTEVTQDDGDGRPVMLVAETGAVT